MESFELLDDVAILPEEGYADKGVSVNLDANVARELRERDEERRRKAARRRQVSKKTSNHYGLADSQLSDQNNSDDNVDDNVDDEEDWNEVLLIPPHLETSVVSREDEQKDDNSSRQKGEAVSQVSDESVNESDDSAQYNEWDELSLSPPPNLPIVIVQAERLFGYVPASDEESMLQEQLQQTMWGNDLNEGESNDADAKQGATDQSKHSSSPPQNGTDFFTSQEFDKQIAELLETGAARHSVHTEEPRPGWIRIQYPPYFCADVSMLSNQRNSSSYSANNNTNNNHHEALTVVKTERLWKFLLQEHDVAVVHRLLKLLCNCSRSLSYKANLRYEISQLAHREHLANQRRIQQSELASWKCGRRKDQLDQLYTVQETMQHRLEMARQRLNTLQNDLEQVVTEKLRQERLTTGQDVGLEAFDFASTMFSFPTGTFLGGDIVPDDEEEDFPLIDDGDDYGLSMADEESYEQDDESNYDASLEEASDGSSTVEPEQEPTELGELIEPLSQSTTIAAVDATTSDSLFPQSATKSKSARAKRKNATRKKRKKCLENLAKEAEHERKLESAKKDEERARDACMTDEFKVAEAFVMSLEDRIAKVDELIETLQEEEWEDEENGVEHSLLESKEEASDNVSLLDQILAMILGSTSPTKDDDMESHVKFMIQEHNEIVNEWRTTFGRLPPPVQLGGVEVGANDKLSEADSLDRPINDVPTNHALSTSNSESFHVNQMRQAYGIENLQTDDWEAGDESHDTAEDSPIEQPKQNCTSQTSPTLSPSTEKTKGFRPGCRI